MSVNGQIELPAKGFSEVDELDVGSWVQILDVENNNTPTVVANFGSGNVAIPCGMGLVIISPPTLVATQDNYNPTSWLTANMVRLDPAGGGSDLTGLMSTGLASTALIRTLRNISLVDSITFKHEDPASVAANRIFVPGEADFVLGPKGSVTAFYDATESRWTFI